MKKTLLYILMSVTLGLISQTALGRISYKVCIENEKGVHFWLTDGPANDGVTVVDNKKHCIQTTKPRYINNSSFINFRLGDSSKSKLVEDLNEQHWAKTDALGHDRFWKPLNHHSINLAKTLEKMDYNLGNGRALDDEVEITLKNISFIFGEIKRDPSLDRFESWHKEGDRCIRKVGYDIEFRSRNQGSKTVPFSYDVGEERRAPLREKYATCVLSK